MHFTAMNLIKFNKNNQIKLYLIINTLNVSIEI